MAKAKVMFLLSKPINKEKSLLINIFNKRNLLATDKKMLDKSETAEMLKVELIIFKNKLITFFQ